MFLRGPPAIRKDDIIHITFVNGFDRWKYFVGDRFVDTVSKGNIALMSRVYSFQFCDFGHK